MNFHRFVCQVEVNFLDRSCVRMKLKYNFSKFNVLAKVEEYFIYSFV